MTANAKRVEQYQWKQRITVVRKGKPAQPVINQVSFDSSGQMQRTTISAPPQETGIRGKIAAGVRQDVKEIMDLAARYNKPEQIAAAIKKAQISEPAGAGTIRIQTTDLIKSGDAITMLVNSTTHLVTHIDINTNYDGGPMTITQEYGQLPAGPNVMKNMKVSVPKKDLVINVESYDHLQQAS